MLKYTGAITKFDAALKLAPKNIEALYKRGKAYGNSGTFDKAITDFNSAIQYGMNTADVYYF